MHLLKLMKRYGLWKLDLSDNESAPERVTEVKEANLVGSARIDPSNPSRPNVECLHFPVLDLDFACTLIESTTPGHYHLFLDRGLTHAQYDKLLSTLVELGLYDKGCYSRFQKNGLTVLRLPWIEKDPKDSKSADRE